MNKVEIVGRLTKDPQVRILENEEGEVKVTRFSVAVNRRKGSKQPADYIPCVSFNAQADYAGKYLKKGNRIGVIGRLQSGSYVNDEGKTIYTLEVIVEEIEFIDKKEETPDRSAEAESGAGTYDPALEY
jgi:single-strand DNA-binding protein